MCTCNCIFSIALRSIAFDASLLLCNAMYTVCKYDTFKCEPINTIVSLTDRPICDTYRYKHNKWWQYSWSLNVLRKCHQELHLKELRKPPPRPRHREEETRKGARGGGNLTPFTSTKSWSKHTRKWVFQRRLWVSWILSSMTSSKGSLTRPPVWLT